MVTQVVMYMRKHRIPVTTGVDDDNNDADGANTRHHKIHTVKSSVTIKLYEKKKKKKRKRKSKEFENAKKRKDFLQQFEWFLCEVKTNAKHPMNKLWCSCVAMRTNAIYYCRFGINKIEDETTQTQWNMRDTMLTRRAFLCVFVFVTTWQCAQFLESNSFKWRWKFTWRTVNGHESLCSVHTHAHTHKPCN